jgi:hypothetical protein
MLPKAEELQMEIKEGKDSVIDLTGDLMFLKREMKVIENAKSEKEAEIISKKERRAMFPHRYRRGAPREPRSRNIPHQWHLLIVVCYI